MDALLQRAFAEHVPNKLRELLKRVVEKINDDVPELSVGFAPRFFAVRDFVKGFTTTHDGEFQWSGGGLSQTWLDK